jgi:hypothetical protein
MNYSLYFQNNVLSELLDHSYFLPMCMECREQKVSSITQDLCIDCLPFCSHCKQEKIMGDYTSFCVDCFWDHDRPHNRLLSIYADPDAFVELRKYNAEAIGVPYEPLPDERRLAVFLEMGGNIRDFRYSPKLTLSSLAKLSIALRTYMRGWKENKDMETWCHFCDYAEKDCICSEEEYISCSECGSDCKGSDWESYRFCSRRCMSRYSRRYDRW